MFELHVDGAASPALVDDCWSHLAQYKWRLDRDGYVVRKSAGRRIYLHHVVMPGHRYPAFVRDHINRNKLDNSLSNLRWVELRHSSQNRGPARKNATGHRGVRFDESKRMYLATVCHNGKAVVRKWFSDADEAGAYLNSVRGSVLPYAV